MVSNISKRWLVLFFSWLILLYFPWWLWLVVALVLCFIFPYYFELLIPAIWYDIVFGLAVGPGFWKGQFIITISVMIIIWLSEQLKKLLIFYQ